MSNTHDGAAMPVIDLELLLQPISDDEPAGSDQSASPQYLQITEAMREDDPAIQREAWEEVRTADWSKVQQLCEDILETKSKDLQVAVWLCEALLRNHGLEGFNDGLQLLGALCAQYWEQLHPQLEEPNMLYRRTNVLTKFFGKLDERLRHISMTAPQNSELRSYRWGDYLDASHIDRLDEEDKRRAIEDGRPTSDMFTASLRDTPDEFYAALAEQLDQGVSLLDDVESIVRQQCEQLRPFLEEPSDADFSLGKSKEAVALVLQFVQRICKERGIGQSVTAEEAEPESSQNAAVAGVQVAGVGGALQSREDAYRALERIADFLGTIEPHSPVPYLLRRAVKWGRMSAQEMLQELYQNAPDLEQLYRLLGLEPPQQESSGW